MSKKFWPTDLEKFTELYDSIGQPYTLEVINSWSADPVTSRPQATIVGTRMLVCNESYEIDFDNDGKFRYHVTLET